MKSAKLNEGNGEKRWREVKSKTQRIEEEDAMHGILQQNRRNAYPCGVEVSARLKSTLFKERLTPQTRMGRERRERKKQKAPGEVALI